MWTALLSTILVINELMASNAGQHMSPAINFDSWIEIYNPGDKAVSLSGMYLSNDAAVPTLWQMPSAVGSVPAKGFKVVWLGSHDIKPTQAPFKLDCDGGVVYLSDKDGQLITKQSYPQALSRTAYARKTDGGDEWGWTADGTPGESNATATFAEKRLAPPVVSEDSRLFNGTLNVKVAIPEGARLMYTLDGSMPKAPVEGEVVVPWQQQVKNGDCEGTDVNSLQYKNGESSSIVKRITAGVGADDSRGIKVHAVANASKASQTQFYVYTPGFTWKTDVRYRFRMKVRADKAAKIKAYAQKKPGEDIVTQEWGWGGGPSTPVTMLKGTYNVTTEWTEIVCEDVITYEQSGEQYDWWGGRTSYALKCIAFNLNEDGKLENNYYFDDISWESLPEGYGEEPTKESVDGVFDFSRTTNLTVRLYQDGYLPSVPVTRSYIQTSNKYTLPIISIVGDQRYFTDPKIGFDCDGDGTNGKTGNGQDHPRNYNMDWDRPVNFSLISPDGEMLFNQDVNIKVSGGWTRSQRFRSFKLKASKVFDGQNRYDYAFFPQKPYTRNKTILLRNGGNDVWTHNARFIDAALETIIQRSGIDIDVQSCVPVIEYVNGELRGVFNMREPNNDDFAYANWGYDDEELDAFENMVMKNGNDSVISHICKLAANATSDEAYNELKTMLDIDEFTNYMAATMFIDNDDWPNNNIKAYRSRNDGRYRFVSFDLDYAFALRNFNKDGDDPFKYFQRFKDADKVYDEKNLNREIVRLLLNLLERDDYRRKFIDTFCLMGGSVFEPSRATAIVDELLSKVKPMTQLMKQQGINDGHDPDRAATTIKNKLNGRSKKMTGHMKTFASLKLGSATAQSVKLNTDTEGARILVNGIEVPYASFDGHLFAPVTLEAKAPAGYQFAGWKSGSTTLSADAVVSLPKDNAVSLTATFKPLADEQRLAEGIAPVRINEVSASNGIFVNEYFKRNDWIELYNTTTQPIDVEGMYLTDNPEKPQKFQIAKGVGQAPTVIPAHGYLIVWCDQLETQKELHATFKLAKEGDELILTAADGSWSDRLVYAGHNSDQTVGRYPDGANDVYLMNVPTIAQANMPTSYMIAARQPAATAISDMAAASASAISLRLTGNKLMILGATGGEQQVSIYNLAGQLVENSSVTAKQGCGTVSIEQLPSGCYVAVAVSDGRQHSTLKFVKK